MQPPVSHQAPKAVHDSPERARHMRPLPVVSLHACNICCLMYTCGGYPKIASGWLPDIFRGVPPWWRMWLTTFTVCSILMGIFTTYAADTVSTPIKRERKRGTDRQIHHWSRRYTYQTDRQSFQYVLVCPSPQPLTPEASRLLLSPGAKSSTGCCEDTHHYPQKVNPVRLMLVM